MPSQDTTRHFQVGVALFAAWLLVACAEQKVTSSASDSNDTPPAGIFASGGAGPGSAWHFVTPNATPGGSGMDSAHAWTLEYAFANAPANDTVWIYGGNYTTINLPFTVEVSNVVFKQMPRRKARLVVNANFQNDCNAQAPSILKVVETATNNQFWDFEITDTSSVTRLVNCHLQNSSDVLSSHWAGNAVYNLANNTKFVNLVIHDAGNLYNENTASGVVISGCIVYNTGWDDDTTGWADSQKGRARGHGHGLYPRNNHLTSSVTISDNVLFNQHGYGVHVYSDNQGDLNNIYVRYNVAFNNGSLSVWGTSPNVGNAGSKQDVPVAGSHIAIEQNRLYFSPNLTPAAGENLFYGLSALSPTGQNSIWGGNYVLNGSPPVSAPSGDWTYDGVADNTNPTSQVLPHQTSADPRRSIVAVYSQSGQSTISLSLGTLGFATNDSFVVWNAQDTLHTVKAAGHYAGSTISVTNDAVAPPEPYGQPSRSGVTTGPYFNALVVQNFGRLSASNISGPTTLACHNSALYTATINNGTLPDTYEWNVRFFQNGVWWPWTGWTSSSSNSTTLSVNAGGITQMDVQFRITDALGRSSTWQGIGASHSTITISPTC